MNHITEQWKLIQYHENYEVSTLGRVRNTQTGKIMRPSFIKGGYPNITLRKHKLSYYYHIHRLVAETFLLPPL